jgi:HSP20 family protein
MLMRTDPFRDLDRLTERLLGTAAHPNAMRMDAYRKADTFYVHFDLPGIDRDAIDLTVERNVLTVKAERAATSDERRAFIVSERPTGTFTRDLFLGETLDADRIQADLAAGVLTLRIPVREAAKPRRLSITSSEEREAIPTLSGQ